MQKKAILRKPKNTGFTLIELLFAVSIMAIIFSVGYANLRGFQQRQHLDNAIKQVKSDLRLAQEMALAGRKPNQAPCTDADSDLVGFQFIRISSSQYQIGAICSTDTSTPIIVKGPESLPTGVSLLGFVDNSKILFNSLGRGTDKDPDVSLRLQLGINEKNIIVTKTGDIYEAN